MLTVLSKLESGVAVTLEFKFSTGKAQKASNVTFKF